MYDDQLRRLPEAIMDRPYRIFIAEDYTILREGLRALVSSDPNFEVVAEAKDGQSAIRGVQEFKPDLALMDLSMPRMSGMDAISEIKRRRPETRIVALTVHKAEEYVIEALRAGADGYVLKDASHKELMVAIKSVLAGRRYISPGISDRLIEAYLEIKGPGKVKSQWDSLTSRERQVLKLIGEGYKNKEIADYLCISPKTVEKHRSNLMKKLDLHSASKLTAYAAVRGLIER
ncbi:MAG: response regulator transcription factor [Thermodesulfobacteriota bacterium]|nr:response regulator transcription factor [Thermodesulfobacteriota bacterium]